MERKQIAAKVVAIIIMGVIYELSHENTAINTKYYVL